MQRTYHIVRKFGGNYIWQFLPNIIPAKVSGNGLQAVKNKYWQNLNLAIGLYGSPHVVCSAKTKVEVFVPIMIWLPLQTGDCTLNSLLLLILFMALCIALVVIFITNTLLS